MKMAWSHEKIGNQNHQGTKCYAASGSRDVLILVSKELEGSDTVPRKKGELTQQDKDRLTSEGIPSEFGR